MKSNNKSIKTNLTKLIEQRGGGAKNIRGIEFQLLYSILCAFDLLKNDCKYHSIRLEGIEDVDLLVLHSINDIYIQVKTSINPWPWSKLKDPINKFLEVLQINPKAHFKLITNFSLKKDIAKLAKLKLLSYEEKNRIKNKFINLCNQKGSNEYEAHNLLQRLEIESIPEDQLWKKLSKVISEKFNLGSDAVDIYIKAFTAEFISWAKERKEITRLELEKLRDTIGEYLAQESEYQASGKGLIDRIIWQEDEKIVDFFEGKGTRPGHIVSNVDVKRPSWLKRIDKALKISKVCILKSSSGQGKSTLLYRYAYENWDSEYTHILRIAKSEEQVEIIRRYLRLKARLGIPILLLIDNASWQTRLWPNIAQECASLGFYVLVSIREEDWYRTARLSLTNYEILEPALDLNEAKDIFKSFQIQNRIHDSVDSAEWAFEKIGEPPLLMEYVYFITHGKMLEERLRDQVKQITAHNEDPAKIEILRRVSLAHELGSPILVNKLLDKIQLRHDPQQVLQSLSEEYLRIEDELLIELHWVRSDHLSKILHEQYLNPARTALSILDAVPSENMSNFVLNAISKKELDTELFMNGLIEKAKDAKIDTILAFLDGIFEAGERKFFEANRGLFDEAYKLVGSVGPFWLSTAFIPLAKIDMIDIIAEMEGDLFENFRKLKEIKTRFTNIPRGIEFCSNFLSKINAYMDIDIIRNNLAKIGQILDWCYLCNIELSSWKKVKNNIFLYNRFFEVNIDTLCKFTQGLYRYDERSYKNWFLKNTDTLIGYLKLHTDCVTLEIKNNELYMEFIPETDNKISFNDQAVSKLQKLRAAIPFCRNYKSQGLWLLPLGLKPSIDETYKNIPQKNLPLEFDVEKNIVWRNIIERAYFTDTFYKLEEHWYVLRKKSLLFVQNFSKFLNCILTNKKYDIKSLFDDGRLIEELELSQKFAPSISIENFKRMGKEIKQPLKDILKENAADKCSLSFKNFFIQLIEYLRKKEIKTGRLAVHNFFDSLKQLPKMHLVFKYIFNIAPDYFNSCELDSLELKAYKCLADLLEVWILNPPEKPLQNINLYIKTIRQRKRQEKLNLLSKALSTLEVEGMKIILPSGEHIEYPITYLPFAFSVDNPSLLIESILKVIKELHKVKDIAGFFCIIPIFNDKRFIPGAYVISSNNISQFDPNNLSTWEWLVPREPPKEIWSYLPQIQFEPYPKNEINLKIQALLIALEKIVGHYHKIQQLISSKNQFEIELYNRYRIKFRKQEENLGDAVIEVKNYLIAEFSQLKNEKYYKTISEFLENLIDSIKKDELTKYIVSAKFNAKEINDALNQLIEIN